MPEDRDQAMSIMVVAMSLMALVCYYVGRYEGRQDERDAQRRNRDILTMAEMRAFMEEHRPAKKGATSNGEK